MPPKKDDKKAKEKPAGWNFDFVEGAILLLFLTGIVTAVIPMISRFINSGELTFYGYPLSGFLGFFKSSLPFLKAFAFMVSGAAAIGTFILNKKGDQVWHEELSKLYPAGMQKPASHAAPIKDPLALKWESIVANSESEDPSLWRLCIIEADIILEDLLRQLRLPGETIGEKLKAVEQSDFTTIEYAWEAHKARNLIAHEGSNYLLNQRETRRIISLYEAVFKEFHLV